MKFGDPPHHHQHHHHLFCASILYSAALQHCIIKLQYITVLNQYLKKLSVLQRYYTVDSISTPRY